MKKLILTDADGVLLDWERPFHYWMLSLGHKPSKNYRNHYNIADRYSTVKANQKKNIVSAFNNSFMIKNLPAFRDSVKVVEHLVDNGYIFHVITSISDNERAHKNRIDNLHALFGKKAFHKITCLGTGEDKDHVLSEYKDSGLTWIEDHVKNYHLGNSMGLNSFLMLHEYNNVPGGKILSNWKDILIYL